MKKPTKLWLIIAAFLILAGCMIFGGVMTVLQWDFTKLSTNKFEQNTHSISEPFHNISVKTDTAKLKFAPAQDGICKVECYEEQKAKHAVTVEEDTLVIEVANKKAWYDYIGIHFGSPKITVYLPKTEYTALTVTESTGDMEIPKDFQFESATLSLRTGDVRFSASASGQVKIQTSTGEICVENNTVGALDLATTTGGIVLSRANCEGDISLRVSTGKTKLTDIVCKNLTSDGSTGDIALKNVVGTGKFSINRGTGDVKFDNADAAEISVETDTGDVEGSLLTNKVFIARTDTGRVTVPNTVTGGKCEITTNTGDITLTVKEPFR